MGAAVEMDGGYGIVSVSWVYDRGGVWRDGVSGYL